MIEGIRWVEIDDNDRDEHDTVRGVVPRWEGMKTHYKLQYLDLQGHWRDVEKA